MRTTSLLFLISGMLVLAGCSDLKKEPASITGPGTTSAVKFHTTDFATGVTSAAFHGSVIRSANWSMNECKRCHGLDLKGGSAEFSCMSCHTKTGGPENCTTCHGDANAAPPKDLNGNTARTTRTVGAHQPHAALCAECHTVPATVNAAGHLDGDNHAEVVFGAFAKKTLFTGDPVPAPAYDTTSQKCSNTYCHGSFRNGNKTFTPVWNDISGASTACGTCHGDVSKTTAAAKALPAGTHPQNDRCSMCHSEVMNANMTFANRAKHINGVLNVTDFSGSNKCVACHGSTNSAPPRDLAGNTSIGARGVGAHQAHATLCAECHTVPADVYSPGHLDNDNKAELLFGTLAKNVLFTGDPAPNPSYDTNTLKCSNTYCHGSFRNGNNTFAPVWNDSTGASGACGTCHGDATKSTTGAKALPGGTHPQSYQCAMCHSEVVNADLTFANRSKHIDGKLGVTDFSGPNGCKACHGTTNAAPPRDLAGNTAVSSPGVGAHQAHVTFWPGKSDTYCAECHVVPQTTYASGHIGLDNKAEVALNGPLAKNVISGSGDPVPNPVYNGTAHTCAGTYCHGSFGGGNSGYVPMWTSPKSDACGTCHGDATTSGLTMAQRALPKTNHMTFAQLGSGVYNCNWCHIAAVDSVSKAGVVYLKSGTAHVNGQVEFGTTAEGQRLMQSYRR